MFARFWSFQLLPCLLLLSACGFQPLYGSHTGGGQVAEELNQIAIGNIPNRPGQMLRNDLIDQMYVEGRPATTLYTLDVRLRNIEEDLGIQADSTSTRSLLETFGDYTLKDKNGKVLLTGQAHSIASFNKLTQQYGTNSAREGATERTINEVSIQIVNRLSLYFGEKKSN